MMIGLSGYTGVGKDSLALALRRHAGLWALPTVDVFPVGLADPIKRIVCEVYDFDPEHVWGESRRRNIPDERYPNPNLPGGYLTPRHALQQLGTEWGRSCFGETWLAFGLRTAQRLLRDATYVYDRRLGLVNNTNMSDAPRVVCITDCRFLNEFAAVRNAGGKLARIKSNSAPGPLFDHPSETEQGKLPDDYFDYVFQNDHVETKEEEEAQLGGFARELLRALA
jgi:hypothetical protein